MQVHSERLSLLIPGLMDLSRDGFCIQCGISRAVLKKRWNFWMKKISFARVYPSKSISLWKFYINPPVMKGRHCFWVSVMEIQYSEWAEIQRDILYRQWPKIIILFPKARLGRNTQSFSLSKSKYSMQNMMPTTLNTNTFVKWILMTYRWRHAHF